MYCKIFVHTKQKAIIVTTINFGILTERKRGDSMLITLIRVSPKRVGPTLELISTVSSYQMLPIVIIMKNAPFFF